MKPEPENPISPEPEILLPTDQFWEEHKSSILGGAAILVVVGVLVIGWMVWSQSQRAAAEALFATASSPGQWQEVISKFPGTPAAEGSKLLLASALIESGERDRSDALYKEVIDRGGKYSLQSAAALGLAENAAFEEADSMELAEKFQQVAIRFPKSYAAPYALYSAGDILTRAGLDADAIRIYKNLAADYPSSPLARMASLQIQRLSTNLPPEAAAREMGGPSSITPDGRPADPSPPTEPSNP